MSLEYDLSALIDTLQAAVKSISEEKGLMNARQEAAQASVSRLENRIKALQANEAELNRIINDKANEVAAARTLVEGADARASEMVAAGHTEANRIINKAKEEANRIIDAADVSAKNIVDHAAKGADEIAKKTVLRRAELDALIADIDKAQKRIAELRSLAAAFAVSN